MDNTFSFVCVIVTENPKMFLKVQQHKAVALFSFVVPRTHVWDFPFTEHHVGRKRQKVLCTKCMKVFFCGTSYCKFSTPKNFTVCRFAKRLVSSSSDAETLRDSIFVYWSNLTGYAVSWNVSLDFKCPRTHFLPCWFPISLCFSLINMFS